MKNTIRKTDQKQFYGVRKKGLQLGLLLMLAMAQTGCQDKAQTIISGLMIAEDTEALENSVVLTDREYAEHSDGMEQPGALAALGSTEPSGDLTVSGGADSSGDQAASGSAEQPKDQTASENPENAAVSEEKMVVYVCGAVVEPDVYQLSVNARVYEAVKAAGGFTPEADQEWQNQAELLSDGQKLKIYTKEETAAMKLEGISADEGGEAAQEIQVQESGMVNLNTADKEELMTLPGIGKAKAEAILQYREEAGGFHSIEEIMQISGIKESVFSKIKEKIKIS